MLRSLSLGLAVLAVALAGCSGNAPKADPVGPGSDLEPTETTGIIRGVAVDQSIRPLAGVVIAAASGELRTEMISDDTGFFGMDGLQPGVWFLSASKVGFDPIQQSADVVAGEADPAIVRVMLTENYALRPYSETYVWSGFLQCSAGVPVVEASVNPCFVLSYADESLSSNVWNRSINPNPQTVQAEMVWKPATAVGSSFRLLAFVPSENVEDLQPDDYAVAQSGSPLVLRVGAELLDNKSVGMDNELSFRVFPGQDQPTAFANQAFEVYITVFYGAPAPEGWMFIEDGPWVYDEAK